MSLSMLILQQYIYSFGFISCLKMCPDCTDVALQRQVSYNIDYSATGLMVFFMKYFMVKNRTLKHQQVTGVIPVNGVFIRGWQTRLFKTNKHYSKNLN